MIVAVVNTVITVFKHITALSLFHFIGDYRITDSIRVRQSVYLSYLALTHHIF